MTQVLTKHEHYRAAFAALGDSLSGEAPWLRTLREQAMERFDALGFPTATRGNERWKYTYVGPIADAVFSSAPAGDEITAAELRKLAPWSEDWITLVFVNGRYRQALSSGRERMGKAQIGNLGDALPGDASVAQQHLGDYAAFQDDAFVALNTALLQDGAFVHLPEDVTLESPVHLLFVTTQSDEPTASHPRTLIVLGKNSKLTLVESYLTTSSSAYFTNAVAEVTLAEGAQLEHYRLLHESPAAYHIGVTHVHEAAGASFHSTSLAAGAAIARNELQVLLDASEAACSLKGLYVTTDSEHIDNHIYIDHAKPHTTSGQYFKGILAGKSHAVFSGGVLVRKDAQQSVASQADKNLILSQGAEIDTMPSLEIYADDVQCTHGATAGAVNEESLYYMRSRGLDEAAATHFLILGFSAEITEAVSLEPLRVHVENLTARALPDKP